MSADLARRVRDLEAWCVLLERAVLVQEKRVWSQATLALLEEGRIMAGATPAEKTRSRRLLEANLRVARESLDHLAAELGYEPRGVLASLSPGAAWGEAGPADDETESPALRRQLLRIVAHEREAGSAHMRTMLRELTARHDEFLGDLAQQVRDDAALHDAFDGS